MRKKIIPIGLFSLLLSSAAFSAPPSAPRAAPVDAVATTQIMTMSINSTSNITTSGNPGALAITLNADGTGSATDNTTTYTIACNTGASGKLKITGAITSGGLMPANTNLTINLASAKGTSLGIQSLGTAPIDLVTGLSTLVSDTAPISYGFTVTNGWTIPSQTLNRTVTLTLTSAS